jgi:hypothetical protein
MSAAGMSTTVFAEMRFWVLVASSVVFPFGLYGVLMAKKAISRITVLVLGLTFVLISGVDIYLLRDLSALARLTPSLADDAVFISELSIGLYLLPALFGGIGINLVSHVLVRHLVEAEKQFEKDHQPE